MTGYSDDDLTERYDDDESLDRARAIRISQLLADVAEVQTRERSLLAEVERLRAENARRREDIGWLYAQMAGQPRLTEGETAHQWTTGEDYANRYITDYGTEAEPAPLAPDEHKLRRVKCATCGQFWTHP